MPERWDIRTCNRCGQKYWTLPDSIDTLCFDCQVREGTASRDSKQQHDRGRAVKRPKILNHQTGTLCGLCGYGLDRCKCVRDH